jgi:hypothetical protein
MWLSDVAWESFFQMYGLLWELAIHLYFDFLKVKPPLMLEVIWEFLPHDRKDFLPFNEKQQPH